MNEHIMYIQARLGAILCSFALIAGLLISSSSHAMRGGAGGFDRGVGVGDGGFHQGGDYYHNNDYRAGGYYYGGNVGAPAVNVVVPYGGYPTYPNSCSSSEQCDSYGNCSQSQVCN